FRGLGLLGSAALAAGGGGPNTQAGDPAADARNRALAAHAAGKLDEAVTAYYQTLEKDPKNKFAFYNLGEIAQRQNRMAAAESFYRLALQHAYKIESAPLN